MAKLDKRLTERLLDAMPVARLALLGDETRPEALPLVCARIDDCLYSPIDGKPKRSARLSRLDHLAREPRVSLLFDHYSQAWSDLWWIKIDAEAVSVTPTEDARFEAATDALAAKYPQYRTTPMFKGEPTMLRFSMGRVRWWAADGEAGLLRWLGEGNVGSRKSER